MVSRRLVVLGVVCALGSALACAACSERRLAGSSVTGHLPSAQSSVSAEKAVTDAYTAYWDASPRAAVLPREQGRALLAPYSEPVHTEKLLDGAAGWQAKGLEPWGRVILHVTSVTVNGHSARVNDCQDVSHAGVAHASTHKLIPGTVGSPRVGVATDMRQDSDGRWLIKQEMLMGGRCAPSRS